MQEIQNEALPAPAAGERPWAPAYHVEPSSSFTRTQSIRCGSSRGRPTRIRSSRPIWACMARRRKALSKGSSSRSSASLSSARSSDLCAIPRTETRIVESPICWANGYRSERHHPPRCKASCRAEKTGHRLPQPVVVAKVRAQVVFLTQGHQDKAARPHVAYLANVMADTGTEGGPKPRLRSGRNSARC
jgi:hypothetical protein